MTVTREMKMMADTLAKDGSADFWFVEFGIPDHVRDDARKKEAERLARCIA